MPNLLHFGLCVSSPLAGRDGEMYRHPCFRLDVPRDTRAGFSLIEMMAVVAIIAIMMSMLAPSITSFSSTAGRKGAVNILMSTLEQARSAALETGSDIYVLLWRREYPERDAIMVVRMPSEWILDSQGVAESKLVPLTKWMTLPEGVLLHKPDKGDNVFNVNGWPADIRQRRTEIPMPEGATANEADIGVIRYAGNGSIPWPTGNHARIVVTEGVRDGSKREALISAKKQSQGTGGGFDIIRMSRFTGRSWLEVTTL